MTAKAVFVGAAVAFAFLGDVWKALHTGALGAAAFVGACATLWIWIVRPFAKSMRQLFRQAIAVHSVILGDDEKGVPSLTDRLDKQDERLAAGDGDFERIEAKVDDLRHDVGGQGGIKERLSTVEGVFDVIGSSERLEIRSAIAAHARDRRRNDDPPPAPTPIRRDP